MALLQAMDDFILLGIQILTVYKKNEVQLVVRFLVYANCFCSLDSSSSFSCVMRIAQYDISFSCSDVS